MNLQPLFWLIIPLITILGLRYSLVNRPKGLKIASFALRAAGIALLALTLCRPFINSDSDNIHAVFLLDVSESVDLNAAKDSLTQIESAIDSLNMGDSYNLFLAGRELKQVNDPTQARDILKQWQEGLADSELRSATPIDELLLTARLAFKADKARRIILYSDGVTTGSNTAETIKTLARENIDVRFEKLTPLKKPELSVISLTPSTHTAYAGQIVRLTVKLATNTHSSPAEIKILHRGVVIANRNVTATIGELNQFHFDVPMTQPGSSTWAVNITAADDHFTINNQARCTINVKGKPRLLILHQKSRQIRDFARALRKQEFQVELRGKYGLEGSLQELLSFDAIIIADVPASDLTITQMNMLKSYVSDFGGGLLMTGSENSFGLGGYYKTPVEEVLPLISRFEKEKEKPSMAMVLVIDKSGSMNGLPIQLAKQAAKAAIELMSPQDQAAVVAFDSRARIICEMTSASDPDTINSNIDTLAAGGGTFVMPGMETAYEMLQQTTAKVRHIIILSDGHSQPADHESMASNMSDSGITVSTVAMGSGADQSLLSRIAEIGKGRYYQTNDPSNVPQIFTRETMQASKSAIKEDLFSPLIIANHPMLSTYTDDDLPFALGYVITKAKPTAQVLMALETGDPLLATCRFGLGTGLAYSSDLTDKWGGEWLAWDQCGKFWAQVLRNIARKVNADGVYVQTQIDNQNWLMDIKRTNPSGAPVNSITWNATLTDQDNNTHPITIQQSGLGLYKATIPLEKVEFASLSLHDEDYNKTAVLHYNRPYPAEYNLSTQPDPAIASLKGCKPNQVTQKPQMVKIYKPFASPMIITAILLFISGILLRRI